jgi:hypothetical protein
MDVYSRYPNRKKPPAEIPSLGFNAHESDSKSPRDNSADADQQGANGEKTEGEKLRLSSYKIIEPEPEPEPESLIDITAKSAQQPLVDVSAAAEEKAASGEPIVPNPPFLESWRSRIRKFAENPTKVYATAGVGLGILLGVVIAVVFWIMGAPDGPYDLGVATSSAAGLKGHLFAKWDKKLEYRLTIEPGEEARQEGFALAVANSPRPLSIMVRLQDAQGFVLCSKEILLKYNARNAAAFAASAPDSQGNKMDADKNFSNQLEQKLNVARLEAQEPERELDRDVFQNQINQDGQITALNAQGEIPCTKKAYGDTISWGLSTNFPSLAEQDELRKSRDEAQANAARLAGAALAAHKKRASTTAVKLLPFSIEGDDAIVDFDASRGIIQTRGGKTFFIDKTGVQAADPKWQDYPVSIHYRCDRLSNCALAHAGSGVLRARLGR